MAFGECADMTATMELLGTKFPNFRIVCFAVAAEMRKQK